MTDAQITINRDGTGSVIVDGETTTIAASGAAEARREATAHIAKHAAELGRPVPAIATENGRSWPLLIGTDGAVTPRPQDDAAAARPSTVSAPSVEIPDAQADLDVTRSRSVTGQPAPSWEQPANDPIISEVPGAQDDLEATRPRAIATEPPAAPRPSAPAPQIPSPAVDHSSAVDELHTIREVQSDVHSSAAPTQQNESQHAPVVDPPAAADAVDADPRWADISQQPATHGFRGTLNGVGLKLAPTDEELAERRESLRQEIAREEEARRADEQLAQEEAARETRRAIRDRAAAEKDRAERAIIQTPFEEPKKVIIANHKGGQGKTTVTYGIGATAGRIRGGDVIAWDANETQGNLGFRAKKAPTARSVVDLLEEAADDFTTVEGSKRATLARFTRSQGDNLFTVLASDESRDRQDLVDADAFEKVHEILGRFYSLILIDTGNNHRVSHFKAALEAADQLVIPVSAGADGAHAAEAMLDSFESLGHSDLVEGAVVLLNDSATRRGDATGIAAKFEQRVRAIIPIPFDPSLDSGDEIDFDALQPSTRAAFQEATAAIADGLAKRN
ncbi:AAA family ATPase [Brachybacterium vulturis]|uniref:nucleotide-binding protein n=1 Tax=Brachybacterium vulturis TaxID=2017484 RepID=UPI00366493E5